MMAAKALAGNTLASRDLAGILVFQLFIYQKAYNIAFSSCSKVNSSCIFPSVCQKWSTTCSHALCNAI